MIISVFVIDRNTNQKLFRSSAPMTSSRMNYYLTEFLNISNDLEGVCEKDTYNLLYCSNNDFRFGMQVTKDHSIKNGFETLKFIVQNSTDDIYDVLVVIDNTLYGGVAIEMELKPIIELDSQEEKIYKMMMENKRNEMAQREREFRSSQSALKMEESSYTKASDNISRDDNKLKNARAEKNVQEIKPKAIEASTQPILLIIKEKLKITTNKDNQIKDNSVTGEVSMVITDNKYKHVEIKMKNLKSSFKYSPYLDKNALKKSILRFDRDRGINKSIPLLKWTSTRQNLPISFEFWNDEDEGKFVNMIDVKTGIPTKNLELKFNKENVSEIEINEDHSLEKDSIVWSLGDLKKNESKSIEIKCSAFDKDCLFPIEVNFTSDAIDSTIEVDKMFVDQDDVVEYEVRKILEVEHFQILSE
jgi:hypothetical protein